MIRTIMVLTFVALALIFVQPLLILWTLLTGDANFMYGTFIGALRIVLRLAGIRVRVEGLENIPSGVCVFTSNHASNLDPVALVPNIPRRVALSSPKKKSLAFLSSAKPCAKRSWFPWIAPTKKPPRKAWTSPLHT